MMEGCKNTLACLIIAAILVGVRSQQTIRNICRDKEVPCDDGRNCIPRDMWCDKKTDCDDGSDEEHCKLRGRISFFPPNTCTEKHFECTNGRCVPVSSQCDSYDNCGDYSDEDEEYCTSPGTPSTTPEEFQTSETDYNYHDYTSTRSTIRSPTTESDRNSRPDYYDQKYDELYSPSNQYSPSSQYRPPPPFHVRSTHNILNTPPTTYSSYSYFLKTTTEDPRIERRPDGYTLIPPRSVLYLPPPRPSYADRYRSQNLNLPAFYFAKNYTNDYRYDYRDRLYYAMKWLISQRDGSYGWGKDTPRALIALSLITNSFSSNVSDNYLMKKSLQTHLGIKILRNETGVEKMSATRLAMYINAVLATCQNPYAFLGLDLVEKLYQERKTVQQYQGFLNPLIYLTLCLANKSVPPQEIQYLESLLNSSPRFRSEISKDIHILTMTALSCFSQTNAANSGLRSKLQEAVRHLLSQRNTIDGSFGNVYTTALAAQALMSINITAHWDPQPTLDYIGNQQNHDGSFGDMLLTYYSIIALSGRSLVHLRNTVCDPVTEEKKEVSDCSAAEIVSRSGPTKTIFYTLRIGHPETFSVSQRLTVPVDTDFMDIMCVAKHMDPRYKFKYKITNGLYGVYSVAGIPNDPERGLFWSLYVLQKDKTEVDIILDRYQTDMKTLIPKDNEELLFWYLPSS